MINGVWAVPVTLRMAVQASDPDWCERFPLIFDIFKTWTYLDHAPVMKNYLYYVHRHQFLTFSPGTSLVRLHRNLALLRATLELQMNKWAGSSTWKCRLWRQQPRWCRSFFRHQKTVLQALVTTTKTNFRHPAGPAYHALTLNGIPTGSSGVGYIGQTHEYPTSWRHKSDWVSLRCWCSSAGVGVALDFSFTSRIVFVALT